MVIEMLEKAWYANSGSIALEAFFWKVSDTYLGRGNRTQPLDLIIASYQL